MRLFLAGVARGMAEQIRNDRSRFVAHLQAEPLFFANALEQISSVLLKARRPRGLVTEYGSDAQKVRQGEAAANTRRQKQAEVDPANGGQVLMLRMVPDAHPRMETGAVKFGDDWPGVFIRGSDAWVYAVLLDELVDAARAEKGQLTLDVLKNFAQTLRSCAVPPESAGETEGDRP
jgi:hypothetical protein